MSFTNLPIGVFDSGMGGLTVLKAMRATMPHEDYLYLGDTARLPYGTKSKDIIIRYSKQVSSYLVKQQIKMLVLACNTASSAALPELRKSYPDIPVVGVIDPGAEAACRASKSGHIGVIATSATVRSGAYKKAILQRRPDAIVESQACPLFAPMTEDGLFEGSLAEGLVARYLKNFYSPDKSEQPDCLVLGCTHYPMLAGAIRNVIGQNVTMVDSAATTADVVCRILKEQSLARSNHNGSCHFFTTDDQESFARIGSLFLGMTIKKDNVQLIDF